MTTRACVFIGLGSNVGDGIAILKGAWDRIGAIEGMSLVSLSHPYLTAPFEMDSRHWFTNAVGMVRTVLSAHRLLEELHRIEAAFGRKRTTALAGYQDRTLDLDILDFEGVVETTPMLVLPHPRLEGRLFVLAPFAEIAPKYRVSTDDRTIGEKCTHLLDRMRAGEVPWQEVKKGEWQE